MPEIHYRSAELAGPTTFRREGDIAFVEATITTGADVQRRGYLERLAITPEAMSVPTSVPLLDNHRNGSFRDLLGSASDFRFEPGAIVAMLRITDPAAQAAVERGDVKSVSIAYLPTASVDSIEDGRPVRTQTASTLREVSLVLTGADPSANLRSSPLPENTNPADAPAPAPVVIRATVGASNEDPAVLLTRATEALTADMGGPEASDAARQFRGIGYAGHAALALARAGQTVGVASRESVLTRAMQTTSDFPTLLTGAGNRVLAASYEAAASPLKRLARMATAPDFRANDILGLGGLGLLSEVSESGEITATSAAEATAKWQLKTFGKTFSISRKALINDDLAAFGRITSELGKSAAETEASALAALLLSNPALSDNVALFHASHRNISATGDYPGIEQLSAARIALRKQVGISGEMIGVVPKFLLVGPDMETEAESALALILATEIANVNPFAGKYEILVEPRITGKRWYVFADPANATVLLLGHLASAPGPQITSREGWEVLGREFRCVLDFGVAAIDHRGAYYNPGAA